jgi:carbamoyltransferase
LRILGIVMRTHDSGLALLSHGVPTLVLEEERFNREKHTLRFPFLSLTAAFNDQGLDIDDIDVTTTPWDMKCFRRSAFSAVMGCLPGSLNLLRPSARRDLDKPDDHRTAAVYILLPTPTGPKLINPT